MQRAVRVVRDPEYRIGTGTGGHTRFIEWPARQPVSPREFGVQEILSNRRPVGGVSTIISVLDVSPRPVTVISEHHTRANANEYHRRQHGPCDQPSHSRPPLLCRIRATRYISLRPVLVCTIPSASSKRGRDVASSDQCNFRGDGGAQICVQAATRWTEGRLLRQAVPEGVGGKLGTVRERRLGEDVVNVPRSRGRCDHECVRDLRVALPRSH